VRALQDEGCRNILCRTREELDLRDERAVRAFFERTRPEYVFLAAARVGGIMANQTLPVEFLLDNLRIQNAVIEAAFATGVRKPLFLGSSCIYPKLAPQPMREEALLSGFLEPTNEAYALAKIAGVLRNASAVTAISRYTVDLLSRLGLREGPVSLLYPGADAARFTGGGAPEIRSRHGLGEAPLIVTVARLTRRKGHDRVVFLEACASGVPVIGGSTGCFVTWLACSPPSSR
jgi:glycosyltransferase involved in cell wall biosynthesis